MAETSYFPSDDTCTILYRLSGKIIHGRGIGKLIGTPTADIQVSRPESLPPIGVYITILTWNSCKHHSVTNIGGHPTLDTDPQISAETMILDFNTEIYDQEVTLDFLKFLRPQKKFQTLSELREQIFRDCNAARDFFHLPENGMSILANKQNIHLGSLCVDTKRRCVTVHGQDLSLTSKEYELLLLFCRHPEWAYSKEQLYEMIWHEPSNGICHPVENLVFQLRKKLRASGYENTSCIKTITGYGYKFIPD